MTMRAVILMIFVVLAAACSAERAPETAPDKPPRTPQPTPKPISDGEYFVSQDGVAKQQPKAGRANIQGTVYFNDQPAADIDMRLCVTPNLFADCIGEKHKARTGPDGVYLFADLEP
jgi:hypothetical protein